MNINPASSGFSAPTNPNRLPFAGGDDFTNGHEALRDSYDFSDDRPTFGAGAWKCLEGSGQGEQMGSVQDLTAFVQSCRELDPRDPACKNPPTGEMGKPETLAAFIQGSREIDPRDPLYQAALQDPPSNRSVQPETTSPAVAGIIGGELAQQFDRDRLQSLLAGNHAQR